MRVTVERLQVKLTGKNFEIFKDDSRLKTTAAGAAAYHIALSEAAPTFIVKVDAGFAAVIIRGDTRILFSKLKALFGSKKVCMARSEEVQRLTQVAPGDVALINSSMKTWIDRKLLEKDFVYGGTGIPGYTLKINVSDLVSVTNATICDFTDLKVSSECNPPSSNFSLSF